MSSHSTDKLEVIIEGLNSTILKDPILKNRVKRASITWKKLETIDDSVFVPDLDIEFNDSPQDMSQELDLSS